MTSFREAIENMAADSLRCVAIAYRSYEKEKVPNNEDLLAQWSLPDDELVLLAIVGIKVRIFIRNFSIIVIFVTPFLFMYAIILLVFFLSLI